MQAALRMQTTVLTGGKIEIIAPQIPTGENVELIILFQEPPALEKKRQSALDILNNAPGKHVVQCAEEVERYLGKERDAWDAECGKARLRL